MKSIRAFAVIALLAIAAIVYAQVGPGISGTLVQQSPTKYDAATQTTTSATSAATLTLTPPGSQYVYIFEIDISNCAGATAVTAAAPTNITTTNITGGWTYQLGSGVTAGQCTQNQSMVFPTGLKASAPGTAVTFVLPTFATNQTVRLNVVWNAAF